MKILFVVIATVLGSLAHAADEPPLEAPYTHAAPQKPIVIERPDRIDDDGNYYYKNQTDNIIGIDKNHDKYYKIDPNPPSTSAMFIHFGKITPYNLDGDNGKTYKSVYQDKSAFVLGGDYERLLGNLAGKWSWKINSGLSTSTGKGSFKHPNPNFTPEEKFTLFVFPNTATVSYKMRFSDKQLLTPYVDGGAGYFTFVEYRDDGHGTAFGGAPVLTAAGGLLLSLTALDQVSEAAMFEDYGVKHLWLDLEFRRIEGLDKSKDFTSNMITGGFGFAF